MTELRCTPQRSLYLPKFALHWVTIVIVCGACTPAAAPHTVPSGPAEAARQKTPDARPLRPKPSATITISPSTPDGSANRPPASAIVPTEKVAPQRWATLELPEIEHSITEPVHSLAVEPERNKAAALGAQAWLFEADQWKPLTIPEKILPKEGEHDEARIFFGRDYQPRIMGTRFGPDGPRPHYLRFRHGAWKFWPRELASFAAKPDAAIYGVLGWNDPEVLCKVGAFCLIKQRKGWSQVPLPVVAPQTAVRIDLGSDAAYALLDTQLLTLGEKRWHPVGKNAPWKGRPGGAWVHGKTAWVSAPEENALYRFDGESWKRYPSPVIEPRGLWSKLKTELWVAGASGAAHFDGQQWWKIGKLKGPTTEVIGHAGRIWFAGSGGVWSAKVPRPLARATTLRGH